MRLGAVGMQINCSRTMEFQFQVRKHVQCFPKARIFHFKNRTFSLDLHYLLYRVEFFLLFLALKFSSGFSNALLLNITSLKIH